MLLRGDKVLNQLIKQHKQLHDKIHNILQQYEILYNTSDAAYHINDKLNKSNDKKSMKQLEKQYLTAREQIYNIEDQIYNIDSGELDNIIKPLPECIEDYFN
jgi:carbonic anhydrase